MCLPAAGCQSIIAGQDKFTRSPDNQFGTSTCYLTVKNRNTVLIILRPDTQVHVCCCWWLMILHRRVRWKLTLVCDSWFLGCNRGVCLNCTPVAFQHPLMRLRFLWFFVKYLLWFGAFLLGCNEGKVLPSYDIFHTSWVKPAPDAYQPKNTAAKTPLRSFFEFRALNRTWF